jgi:hypothetical protein
MSTEKKMIYSVIARQLDVAQAVIERPKRP